MNSQQETAVERAAKIYAILKKAAANGGPCLSNPALAERFSCGTTAIVNAFHFLEANGMISVERGNDWRVVTIRATGQKTARTRLNTGWEGEDAAALNEALRRAKLEREQRGIA